MYTHKQETISVRVLVFLLRCPVFSQHLMTSEDSPIIEYYPPDFKTDLNGKQQEWEAVVLIPFIDEVRAWGVFVRGGAMPVSEQWA